jgi:hypothetical protein
MLARLGFSPQHVLGDDRGSAAVVSVAGGGIQSFQGGFADVLAFGFGDRGGEREQQPADAGGVVDAAQRSRERSGRCVRGEVVGQLGNFGGVAPESFHLTRSPPHSTSAGEANCAKAGQEVRSGLLMAGPA